MSIALVTFDLDDTLWNVAPVMHGAEAALLPGRNGVAGRKGCQEHEPRDNAHEAIPGPPPRHFAHAPVPRSHIRAQAIRASLPFQTFSLAMGDEARIDKELLDRFLACMKPASTT